MKGIEEIQAMLFEHELETKLFHFQTAQYGAHKASDAYLAKLRDNADLLIETLRGHLSEKEAHIDHIKINVKAPTDASYPKRVQKFAAFLEGLGKMPSDLANIRDGMVADAQQLLYLLRFK